MRIPLIVCLLTTTFAFAEAIQPARGPMIEEAFLHQVIRKNLEGMGYTVNPELAVEYRALQEAIQTGKIHYTAAHWQPVEGVTPVPADIIQFGPIVNAKIGIYIDKDSAQKYKVNTLADMKNPVLLNHYKKHTKNQSNASLVGCDASWSCREWVQKELEDAGLAKDIVQTEGKYIDNLEESIRQYVKGEPIMVVAWSPFWAFSILKLNEDIVPIIEQEQEIYIQANAEWIKQHPKIAEYFSSFYMSTDVLEKQNYKIYQGENTQADIARHVDEYINTTY